MLNKIAEIDGHHMCVVKHSFKLAKMSEVVDLISTLAMDMAVFVVHAHESWPSINEDNRGVGYTKIYRALLQATGKKKALSLRRFPPKIFWSLCDYKYCNFSLFS